MITNEVHIDPADRYGDLCGQRMALIAFLHGQPEVEWPLYSYDCPSARFWHGFALGLHARGFTDRQVRDILQSKLMRWMFDNDNEVQALGAKMAQSSWITLEALEDVTP